MIKHEVEVYAVSTNTDLTEGRGREYDLWYFTKEEDARKAGRREYVMGSDCPVTKKKIQVVVYESFLEFQKIVYPEKIEAIKKKLTEKELEILGLK